MIKPIHLRSLLATTALLCAGGQTTHADIIIMKDGKKYEKATVKSETPDSVTFEYFVAGKIKDTRTELKASVQQVVRQRPEELEVVELRKVLPTGDLMTADKYEQIVTDTLRPFVSKYPGSPEAAEIEKMIKTLTEEKEKVVSGQLKMEGRWLSPDEVKRDSHTIDAFKVRSEMKELAAAANYKEALVVWDKIKDREEGFTDTLQYVFAIPEVAEILVKYKEQLTVMLREQPIIQKRRDDNIKSLVEPDLSRTLKAIEAEKAEFKGKADMEKRTRDSWVSIYKYDKKSMEDALKQILDEQAKVATIDVAKTKLQNEALTSVYRFLADKNLEQATEAMARATAITTQGGTTKAMQTLKKKLAELKAEVTKKRTQSRIYGGSTNKMSGSAVDDRVAKVASESKDKDEKTSAIEQAKSERAAKAQAEAEERKAKRAKTSGGEPTEEAGGMNPYLVFGGGGLLAILLGAMFMQKKKKED